jgi:SNF2 family DNA or RNA helicase
VSSPALYHPAWIIQFQIDMIAKAYLLRQCMVVADMGTGKAHIGMGLGAAALMYQDADLVLIVCEKNKVLDFRDELAAHTSMSPVVIYHGPGRHKRLSAGEPMVVITSYETARQDLAVFASKRARKALDGPLLQMLLTRRPVIIYDEISAKLGNRSSAMYKAHTHMLARLRTRDPQLIVAGMTGTPIERDWENAFNALRLLTPSTMPQVGEFEKRYTYGRDDYNRLKFRSARMHEFAGICAPRMLRKRKTDPDVRDQFPAKTEEFVPCEMHADQQRLYTLVEDLGWDENGDERKVPGLLTVLRQLAGHPAAVLRSDGKLAQIIRESLGPALLECSSVKTELLLDLARRIADEDAKLLAFTFYGQSVLPVLVGELTRAGHALFVTHGGMSANEQHEERARFRAHQGGGVLLSSDAGARGVNVPEATCVAEYEAGLTHALRTQRFARAHRIGHDHGPLTCLTFVLDGTIEVPLMKRALSRNQQQDELLRDDSSEAMAEGYLTAADRRLMFSQARKRKS